MAYPLPVQADPGLCRQGQKARWWWKSWTAVIETHCQRRWASSVERQGAVLPLEASSLKRSRGRAASACRRTIIRPPEDDHSRPSAGHVRRMSPPGHVLCAVQESRCTVLGDIGCYTLGAPAAACSYGHHRSAWAPRVRRSTASTRPWGRRRSKRRVAVIGDSTFMHSGMTGLANIAYNQSNSTVIILDNSITGMTGHQQNPTTGYQHQGGPGRQDGPGGPLPGHGHPAGSGWWTPMTSPSANRPLKEELAADGAVGHHLPAGPACCSNTSSQAALSRGSGEACRSCKACMRLRLSRHRP